MAQPWTTGPVGVFVGPMNCSASAALYLGCGDAAPEIQLRPAFKKLFNDYGGTMKPADEGFGGEDAMTTVGLARWNEPQLEAIENYARASTFLAGALPPGAAAPGSALNPGNHPFGDRGTLMQQEQQYFTLFLLFPFAATKAAFYPGAVPGYRFPCTKLVMNTRPGKGLEQWSVKRVGFESQEYQYFHNGLPGWLLYDNVVAGLPPMT